MRSVRLCPVRRVSIVFSFIKLRNCLYLRDLSDASLCFHSSFLMKLLKLWFLKKVFKNNSSLSLAFLTLWLQWRKKSKFWSRPCFCQKVRIRKARNILSDPQEIAKAIFFCDGMYFSSSQKILGRRVGRVFIAEKLVVISLFEIKLFNCFNRGFFIFFVIKSSFAEESKA